MANKTLNTRIKLRYASYAEWQTSTIQLLPGEMAVCYIEANNSEIKNTAPTVLFKVGDGKHTFKDLKWASGRAADVYDWAKQEGLDIVTVGNGNVVASISWDAEANDGRGALKYTTASVATSEGLKALQDTVAELTGHLNTLKGRVDGHDTLLEGLRTDVDSKVSTSEYEEKIESVEAGIATNLRSIQTLNGNAETAGSVAKAVKDAIDQEVSDRNAAVEVEKGRAEQAELALSNRIKDYEDKKDTFALASDVEGSINSLSGEINRVDGKVDTVDGRVDTVAGDLEEVSDKVNTLIGTDSGKSVRTIAEAAAADVLAEKLIPSDAVESLDTLEEIARWIQDHPEDASAMNAQITSNKEAIELLNKDSTTVGSVAHAVAEETERAEQAESNLLNEITRVEGKVDSNKTEIDDLRDNRISPLEETVSGHNESINGLVSSVSTLDSTAQNHEGRLSNVESSVNEHDSSIIDLQSSSDDHEGRIVTLETSVSTLETDVSEIKGDYLTSADRKSIDEKIENDIKVVADEVAAIKEDYLTSQDFLILDCGSYNNNN